MSNEVQTPEDKKPQSEETGGGAGGNGAGPPQPPGQSPGFQVVKIEDEMRGAYLDYAMSVIIGRALPDVRDGLKPVHRRALYAMYDLGNTHGKPYKKSARVVGDVIGKYHPHGDVAVYDSVVRMAQDFSLRYPLVDGQGNFGSVDGDSPAAMRYTEVRMERITAELLADLEKDTVDFVPNYDDSLEEPQVLPAKFPNLLVNGSSGIAVGMATNIPPHNLTEIIDATIQLIAEPTLANEALCKIVQGPDFPTGGIIVGNSGIRKAYQTGRGVITVRGRAEIEPCKKERERLIISELPYQVNKARLIERIAELVRDKRVEGISDLRDESDRRGMRVVIDIKKGENANVVLNRLYKLTQLQESFGIMLLAIHHNQPKLFHLKNFLWAFVEHRKDVVLRRTAFDLKKAEAKAHILEGLKRAVENLDAVINLIKGSKGPAEAKTELMKRFEFTEKQAQAILDMRLQRLTGLERDKIVQDYQDVIALIEKLKAILASETRVFEIIRNELQSVKDTYGDTRRTEISLDESSDFEVEDLIADEQALVTITHQGYIKRTDPSQFRAQHRGGRGIRGASHQTDDFVTAMYQTSTHSYLLCFTDRGKVYRLKVYQIPEVSRTGRGKAIVNLVSLGPGEKICAILPVKEFSSDVFATMVTRNGVIKRTVLSDFKNIHVGGIIAIGVKDGDRLVRAKLSDGKSEVFICSKEAKCIRFKEGEVRVMGRTARGVAGMNLKGGDEVVSMEILPADQEFEILTVTSAGYGKRTPIQEYRAQSRGGMGIISMRFGSKGGKVIGCSRVYEGDELMMVSTQGQMIRVKTDEISGQGRAAQGVKLMNLTSGEQVVAVETIVENLTAQNTQSQGNDSSNSDATN